MKSKLMLFIAFLTIALFCYSQTSKYVVVTFSAKRGIDKHFVNYYWITPVDSIKGMNFVFIPCILLNILVIICMIVKKEIVSTYLPIQ